MSFAIQLIVSPLALALAASPVAGVPLVARTAEAAPESTEPADGGSPAKADPQLERAMESYNLGTAAYNAARYEDALGHFQAAATLYASADFQYNIGLCYERLNKPEEAIRAYRTYLRAKPDANDRANVEDRIFQLEKELEDAKNKPAQTQPDPQPPVEPDPPPLPAGDPNAGRGLIIGGAVMAGVGAAIMVGGGIGFGLAARDRSDQVDAVFNDSNPDELTFEAVNDLDEDGRRLETFQIITVAVGAAVTVGGVALLAVGLNKRKKAAASPSASVVPTFGRRSAGLSLSGRF